MTPLITLRLETALGISSIFFMSAIVCAPLVARKPTLVDLKLLNFDPSRARNPVSEVKRLLPREAAWRPNAEQIGKSATLFMMIPSGYGNLTLPQKGGQVQGNPMDSSAFPR